MKKNLFAPALLTCCFIFLTAFFADLNGKWTGVLTIPDGGTLTATFNFKVDGDKLSGTAESDAGGVLTIENGKVSGDNFSFTVNVGGTDILHSGKVYKDSCGMDIDFGGAKTHTTIMRVKN